MTVAEVDCDLATEILTDDANITDREEIVLEDIARLGKASIPARRLGMFRAW